MRGRTPITLLRATLILAQSRRRLCGATGARGPGFSADWINSRVADVTKVPFTWSRERSQLDHVSAAERIAGRSQARIQLVRPEFCRSSRRGFNGEGEAKHTSHLG